MKIFVTLFYLFRINVMKNEKDLTNLFRDINLRIGENSTLHHTINRGGCGLKGCGCSKGHWVCITKGRTEEGVVEGKTVKFKSRMDMENFLNDTDALSNLRLEW